MKPETVFVLEIPHQLTPRAYSMGREQFMEIVRYDVDPAGALDDDAAIEIYAANHLHILLIETSIDALVLSAARRIARGGHQAHAGYAAVIEAFGL